MDNYLLIHCQVYFFNVQFLYYIHLYQIQLNGKLVCISMSKVLKELLKIFVNEQMLEYIFVLLHNLLSVQHDICGCSYFVYLGIIIKNIYLFSNCFYFIILFYFAKKNILHKLKKSIISFDKNKSNLYKITDHQNLNL